MLPFAQDDEESSSSGNESSDMLKQRKTSETAHSDMTPHGVVCQETPIDVSEFTNRADGDVVPIKGTGEEPVVNNKVVCVCVCVSVCVCVCVCVFDVKCMYI